MSDLPAPENPEAERELLGGILAFYSPDLLAKVREAVSEDDFARRSHEIVYRAILAVERAGDHVDERTVSAFLASHHAPDGRSYLDEAGGQARLQEMIGSARLNGIVERARIVAVDAEWRRRLVSALGQAEACRARDVVAWRAALGGSPRLEVIEGGKAVAS